MIKVDAKQRESLDDLLRRFKKLCDKEGLIREVKRTAYYEKPSETKRRKQKQIEKKIQKEKFLKMRQIKGSPSRGRYGKRRSNRAEKIGT